MEKANDLILTIDVGSTSIRAFIFDKTANIISRAAEHIPLIHPQPGWVEQNPIELWEKCQKVVREATAKCKCRVEDIKCIGLTTQRTTFLTWDKKTSKPLHNLITWQDTRAVPICDDKNNSWIVKGLQKFATVLYMGTKTERFSAASHLKFSTLQACTGLSWVLHNLPEVQQVLKEGNLLWGTVDTWLLWNLTGGRVHATDYSNFSATGMWDPFIMQHNSFAFFLLDIPQTILPKVMDTSGFFGNCIPSVFGEDNKVEVPITAMAADQQAALFGQCCFNPGDVHATLGTGCFININTGNQLYSSKHSLYPMVGWKIGKEVAYTIEGVAGPCGGTVEWAKEVGFFDSPAESAEIAASVPDSNGVVFVPAFNGLLHPWMDGTARASFQGITRGTKKEHMVRAILESLGFCILNVLQTFEEDVPVKMKNSIKVDGGVTQNNFIMQFVSDITKREIDCASEFEMTSLGAAFLAGLHVGIFKDRAELIKLRRSAKTFKPSEADSDKLQALTEKWQEAAKRSLQWEKS